MRSATALPPVALFALVQAPVVAWLTSHLKAPNRGWGACDTGKVLVGWEQHAKAHVSGC